MRASTIAKHIIHHGENIYTVEREVRMLWERRPRRRKRCHCKGLMYPRIIRFVEYGKIHLVWNCSKCFGIQGIMEDELCDTG